MKAANENVITHRIQYHLHFKEEVKFDFFFSKVFAQLSTDLLSNLIVVVVVAYIKFVLFIASGTIQLKIIIIKKKWENTMFECKTHTNSYRWQILWDDQN